MNSRDGIVATADAQERVLIESVCNSLARILLAGGVTPDQIRSSVEKVCAASRLPSPEAVRGVVHLGQNQRLCMELMCHWRRDPDFCGPDGLPCRLRFDGSCRSFVALCDRVSGIRSPREILDLLLAFDAVGLSEDGFIEARTPTFILSRHESGGAIGFDGVLRQVLGYLRVIEYNMFAHRPFIRPRFERSCSVVLPEKLLPVAERFVRERGQDFVDSVDEWLLRQALREEARHGEHEVEIGAGAYFLCLGNERTD